MRKLIFAFSMLAASLSASELVTVEQLEQKLTTAHEKRDKDLARLFGDSELTERLSSPKLVKLQAALPGEKSRLALLVLGDASAFLPLPAAEIPDQPIPGADTQELILSRAAENLALAIHKLPDFFARKTTTRFHDLKVSYLTSGEPIIVEHQPFQFLDTFSDTVHYRNNQEVEETNEKQATSTPMNGLLVEATNEKQATSTAMNGLVNWGVFGPMMRIVVNDIYKGKMEWSHWEQRGRRSLAVFRYSIPKERSHYIVKFCCLGLPNSGLRRFESMPAYHGEIAIDPETGVVYRLVLITELSPSGPIPQAQIMVEYEDIEIGGRIYVCPRRSVTISTATVQIYKPGSCQNSECTPSHTYEPRDTWINDVVYDSYRVFRSESKILP